MDVAPWLLGAGLLAVFYMFYGWFGTVIGESQRGMYNEGVDKSFRMGMMWFIFSEVMFFGAFFGALYYARQLSVPWLGGEGSQVPHQPVPLERLRSCLADQWPGDGRRRVRDDSGVWLAGDQHRDPADFRRHDHDRAPRAQGGQRGVLKIFLAATFLLGFLFVGLQAEEYMHAYHELNLTLGSGVYGSTFFMLTGFHGLHVTIGAIMLLVIWLRVMKGHFTPEHHFAFEGVAWYWHFVDVVWLGLFIFVYWL